MSLHLETERLFIREWRESDIGPYLTLSKDVGYNVFSPPGHYLVKDNSEALEKLRVRIALFDAKGLGKFPVFLRTSGEFIGTVGFEPYTLDGRQEVELGYRLCLAFWGKGYATEAVKAVLDYGFSRLELKRVIAFALRQNLQSLKLIENLGFKFQREFQHAGLLHKLYDVSAVDFQLKNPVSKFRDFDESLLEINLQKTIEQRVLSHNAALEVALEFQKAGRELREAQSSASFKSTRSHEDR